MQKFLNNLKLRTPRECLQKIWICFAILFFMMGINFSKLVMPLWILLIVTFAIACYSILGVVASTYYLVVGWKDFRDETRLGKVFYWMLLATVTTLNVCILNAFLRAI
jgi:hypothetical protein